MVRQQRTDRELDALLGRGRLSGPEKDRIWEGIEARLGPRRRLGATLLRPVASLALAACVLATGVWALGPGRDPLPGRGLAEASPLRLEAACSGPCRPGAQLLFRGEGVDRPLYVAAYAVRADGTRIWYFPDDAGVQPRLLPGEGPVLLSHGALLGPEHTPGTYTLHVSLSVEPRSRDEVLRGSANGTPLLDTLQRLEVVP
jgi:hypothetical protein